MKRGNPRLRARGLARDGRPTLRTRPDGLYPAFRAAMRRCKQRRWKSEMEEGKERRGKQLEMGEEREERRGKQSEMGEEREERRGKRRTKEGEEEEEERPGKRKKMDKRRDKRQKVTREIPRICL